MTQLNQDLRRSFALIAQRRVPPAWITAQPTLAGYATPADLVAAVRNDDEREVSDTLVRALLQLAPHVPDASLVLLEALAGKTLLRIGAVASPEYREDLITDLACVMLDCDDLLELDNLVRRIGGRAHRRCRRRLAMEKQRTDNEVELEWGIEYVEPVRSAEDAVVARVQLDHVCDLLVEAIGSGALAKFAWEDFRDGRLAPLLGYPRTEIDKDRLYKRGREVRRHLSHAS
jgi:hypothetical protein